MHHRFPLKPQEAGSRVRSSKLAHFYDPGCKALLDRISDQAHIIETDVGGSVRRGPKWQYHKDHSATGCWSGNITWLARQRRDLTRATAARKSPKANRPARCAGPAKMAPIFAATDRPSPSVSDARWKGAITVGQAARGEPFKGAKYRCPGGPN
jgi:hypothetical protein